MTENECGFIRFIYASGACVYNYNTINPTCSIIKCGDKIKIDCKLTNLQ